jgi:uncharacterized membrane protein YphA (DoxX/SURF4 family)
MLTLSGMVGLSGWGVGRRIGFRFGILVGALLAFPFPIGAIPKTAWLADVLNRPLEWVVSWFACDVLGLGEPSFAGNGSGDRSWNYLAIVAIVVLAALGTIVWSVVDRRRTAHPRLAAGAYVALRYYLASAMLGYGLAKVLKLQFADLSPAWLDRRVGEMSPMGLLWTFMGYSRPYTVFVGLVEVLGGVLLLSRRTATLGALIIIAIMTNVVLLNFCYDVPVKLYSMQLLVMALVIALPSTRRLIAAAMGRAVAEIPPRARMAPRSERIRKLGKLAMLGAMACNLAVSSYDEASRTAGNHELAGTWSVDAFIADAVEHPPLATDPDRWRAISASPARLWISPMTGGRVALPLQIDPMSRTIRVEVDDPAGGKTTETWRYARPAPDRLVIDGVHAGKSLHVTLHLEAPPLLVTRGFRWISEAPFVR